MASAQLTRTPSSASNRRTWTWSAWVKRSSLSTGNQVLFEGIQGGFPEKLQFTSGDYLEYDHDIAGTDYTVYTTRLFRDVNAWYHIMWVKDTTQATETDRIKLYVNGEQQTLTEHQLGYPGQNYEGAINNNVTHYIGANNGSEYFDGQMAHVNFVDGTALAPAAFGEADTTTGIWRPKVSPSVTYSTNGFFLKMDNAANMGLDSGGGSNNFTTGGTIIQTKDTPSNVFATLNPLNVPTSNAPTFANVNNTSTTPGSSGRFGGTSTLGMSAGKYYWEAKYVISGLPRGEFGVSYDPGEQARNNSTASNYADAWCYQSEGGHIRNNNSNLDQEATYTNGDIVMCALDLTNNKIYFGKNGTWVNSGDPTSGASGTGAYSVTADKTYFTITSDNTSGSDQQTYQFNFGNGYFGTTAVSSAQNPDDGNGIFEYDVPAGYRALCTKSLNAQEYS